MPPYLYVGAVFTVQSVDTTERFTLFPFFVALIIPIVIQL